MEIWGLVWGSSAGSPKGSALQTEARSEMKLQENKHSLEKGDFFICLLDPSSKDDPTGGSEVQTSAELWCFTADVCKRQTNSCGGNFLKLQEEMF